MNASPQPLSPLEVQVVELLDEHPDRLGSHPEPIAARVERARSWLSELQQEEQQLQASPESATPDQRQKAKQALGSIRVKIQDCQTIISKYDKAQRALLHQNDHPEHNVKKTPKIKKANKVASPAASSQANHQPSVPSIASPPSAFSPSTSELQNRARSPTADSKPSFGARCLLTVVEDAKNPADDNSVECEVLVKLRPLSKGDVMQNKQGARSVVKSMFTFIGQEKKKIEDAEVGTSVSVILGPVVGANGQRIDGSVALNASMLTCGTELRSAVILTAEEAKHICWYKVAKSAC
jgi:hypothetical protein